MEVDAAPNRWSRVQPWIVGPAALALFLLSIQLLKSSIAELEPVLRVWLPVLIQGDLSALGASWLAAYLLLNGSVVAAVALTLFNAALVTAPQLLLMVFGSRLGAAGIVLVVGVADFFQRRRLTVRKASELGIVTFLVTHTVGIPATVLGYLWIRGAPLGWMPEKTGAAIRHLQVPHFIGWMVGAVVTHVGPPAGLVGAIALLMVSLRLFNAVVKGIDFERLREQHQRFLHSRWIAFGIGLGLTALSTSIAFSLGIVVPIYNRGYLKRGEVIPYILGANIGTLLDTVAISFFIEVAGGVEAVLLTVTMTTLVTIPALLLPKLYQLTIEQILERIVAGRRAFVLFLISLALVPLGAAGLGWWMG